VKYWVLLLFLCFFFSPTGVLYLGLHISCFFLNIYPSGDLDFLLQSVLYVTLSLV
jgi:hypothetical protein